LLSIHFNKVPKYDKNKINKGINIMHGPRLRRPQLRNINEDLFSKQKNIICLSLCKLKVLDNPIIKTKENSIFDKSSFIVLFFLIYFIIVIYIYIYIFIIINRVYLIC
jgi:hypothetical protein